MNIGSVFLGDSTKKRGLSASTSTPPSSPPGTAFSMSGPYNIGPPSTAQNETKTQKAQHIDPAVSLELRLRWIEALIMGTRFELASKKGKERETIDVKESETLSRTTDALQRRLQSVIDGNDGLKRFMNQYDQHAHLLTPAFALSGLVPEQPNYEDMSSRELEILLADMEQDIRAAARDMIEIEDLEKKGVTDAGKLGTYELLRPRLEALIQLHEENLEQASVLEKRVAHIIEKHAVQIDALSELFVVWDEHITDSESKISRAERENRERERLGF